MCINWSSTCRTWRHKTLSSIAFNWIFKMHLQFPLSIQHWSGIQKHFNQLIFSVNQIDFDRKSFSQTRHFGMKMLRNLIAHLIYYISRRTVVIVVHFMILSDFQWLRCSSIDKKIYDRKWQKPNAFPEFQ